MEKEPAISSENMIQAIKNAYGIEIETLRFLFSGWGGDCYFGSTHKEESYFLKLHDPDEYIGVAPVSMGFYLPLMHQLHTKRILPHIPQPLPTHDGGFFLEIESQVLVITNYIQGETIGFGRLPDQTLIELAEMVGLLHSSMPKLEFEHPFIEGFQTPFVPELMKSLDELEETSSTERMGINKLRGLVLSQRTLLQKSLERLAGLRLLAKAADPPMVICHTDLHGGNLMRNDQGTLYLLDWENAMIAPREHDMIFFTEDHQVWDSFWSTYSRHFDQVSLDSDLLAFYLYRRSLEDVAGFVFRIMEGNGSQDRDLDDLKWLVGCLAGLDKLETTVSGIMGRLDLRE